MQKPLLLAVAAAVIGAGVFAFAQFRTLSPLQSDFDRMSSELASEKDALARLSAKTQELEGVIASLKEDNERLRKERDEAGGSKLAGNPVGKEPKSGGAQDNKQKPIDLRGVFQGFAKRLDDPETRKSMKQGQQRMVTSAYGSLFKQMGLSEQETGLVAELIAERNFAALDKGRKALDGGGDEALVAVRKEIDAAKAVTDAKLKTVLGTEKFDELTAYEQNMGDRRALDYFSRNFENKNAPLASEQKGALTEIMRQERLKSPVNEIPDLGGGPGMSVLMTDAELEARNQREQAYNQRVAARAPEAGLSPAQVLILQDSFKQRNEWRDFGARMGRAFIRPQP